MRLSLATKLVAFTTLLAVAGVVAGFFVVTLLVRSHTKRLLAATLAHHQTTLSHLQRESLQGMVRTSSLLADSPTLRAALETYEGEEKPDARIAGELLATIQAEADKVAFALDHDLLVVSGRDGRVLAASGRAAEKPRTGEDFAVHPIVRAVLEPEAPAGGGVALLTLGGEKYRAGTVPILLRGFLIGTLTVGDRLDASFVDGLARTFDCDVAVVSAGRVLGSTVPALEGPLSLAAPSEDQPTLLRSGGEEYVLARVPFGSDGEGAGVELLLLNSLTRAVGTANRSLAGALLACGAVATLLGAAAAWKTSRSVVRPLDRFVGYVHKVAATGDRAERFPRPTGCVEVDALSATFDRLLDSLLAHENRLRDAAREELDRLERLKESEKLAALGRMLSGAAHEINNPLTGVIGNVELALRLPALPDEVRQRLLRIEKDGRRVSALVKSLLKISHRDTGARGALDVNAVLKDAVEVRRHDFASAGMTLRLELGAGRAVVHGSELELEQVFLNIVNNAYDALHGRPSASLTARTEVSSGQVRVVFEDDGPGLPHPEQVFDPFFTTKPVGKGTGLGLSICHSIVHAHGGEITAENVPSGGARFALRFPESTGELAVSPAPPAPAPEAQGPFAASVLVVDDEPSIVDLQTDLLASLGAAVDAVGTGAEAIERLRVRAYDLVVSDLKMPGGVSGEDLFRWVAAHRPEAAGRFLFVTGDVAGGSWRDAEEAGARILAKPFSTDDYLRAVRDAVGGSRHAR
jgi:signal transduction histidine kinase/ActR/RegA family two-component response regulator